MRWPKRDNIAVISANSGDGTRAFATREWAGTRTRARGVASTEVGRRTRQRTGTSGTTERSGQRSREGEREGEGTRPRERTRPRAPRQRTSRKGAFKPIKDPGAIDTRQVIGCYSQSLSWCNTQSLMSCPMQVPGCNNRPTVFSGRTL